MPAAVQNESKIPVGTVLLGKYRVHREIGRGGMAAVYEAEQLSLGKRVALKVLAQELAASNIVIERFFREARAAASVKSPHIVEIYDSGRIEDGRPFIAMELLHGESLYERMASVRIIDVETTLRTIVHCAKGLMKAHAAGIVHRDLKPENIFLARPEDGDGEELGKILDFGLAKFYAPVAPDEKTKRLTREGAVFGTPAYMSPEQVKGQGNVDHRADLWALGCMAYECLIGRPVWNMDQGVAMTFAAIATAPIPVPSRMRPDLPASFDAWFRKALERDPDRRYQTAKELADALVEAFGPRAVTRSQRGIAFTSDPVIGLPSSENSQPAIQPYDPGGGDWTGALPRPPESTSGEVPATADPSTSRTLPASPARLAASSLFLLMAALCAIVVFARQLRPVLSPPLVISTVTASTTGGSETPTAPAGDEPSWAPLLAEGQRLFAAGDLAGAQARFKEVAEQGGAAVGRAFLEQVKVAAAAAGPCRTAALSHPRIGLSGHAGRPSVAASTKGAIVSWIDDHEQPGREHAYSVSLDPNGKVTTRVRDLTPESAQVVRASLEENGDHAVLLYWDAKGRDAGVRIRALDPEGRIAQASVLVGGARAGSFWPSLDRSPQGFFVVWQDDRDKDGDDLFIRHLSLGLETLTPEMRLTDYVSKPKAAAAVRQPAVAVAANTLLVAYRLERDKERSVVRLRVPLVQLEKGLDEPNPKDPPKGRQDRLVLGAEVANVSEDKAPAEAPAIACGAEGCFIVWHGEQGGAYAAMLEPREGRVIWRKRFAERGGHPAVAVNRGQVATAYFDQGKVKMAFLTRDGLTAVSALGRVTGEHPRPTLAPGNVAHEWMLAWEDLEAHPSGAQREPWAARIACK